MLDPRFGVDVALKDGDFVTLPAGDVALVEGLDCLAQDLARRLTTPQGSHWAHADYGVRVYRFFQSEDTPLNRLDLEQEIQSGAEADPRVVPGSAWSRVTGWDRSKITIELSVIPIGRGNRLNMVLGYGINDITVEVARGGF